MEKSRLWLGWRLTAALILFLTGCAEPPQTKSFVGRMIVLKEPESCIVLLEDIEEAVCGRGEGESFAEAWIEAEENQKLHYEKMSDVVFCGELNLKFVQQAVARLKNSEERLSRVYLWGAERQISIPSADELREHRKNAACEGEQVLSAELKAVLPDAAHLEDCWLLDERHAEKLTGETGQIIQIMAGIGKTVSFDTELFHFEAERALLGYGVSGEGTLEINLDFLGSKGIWLDSGTPLSHRELENFLSTSIESDIQKKLLPEYLGEEETVRAIWQAKLEQTDMSGAVITVCFREG